MCVRFATIHSETHNPSQRYLITRKPTHPSVIIVIVLGDKDVVLLQQRSKALADQSPHIQEGHHYESNPEKAEGGLLPSVTHPTIETTKLVHVRQLVHG